MTYRLHCDSCEALAINGVPAHESGCPRAKEQWTKRRGGFMVPKFCDTPAWAEKPKPKPKLAEGYTCGKCGAAHKFNSYVYAHWQETLRATCTVCHNVDLIKGGKRL